MRFCFKGGEQSSHGDGPSHEDGAVIAEWSNGRPLVVELRVVCYPSLSTNLQPQSISMIPTLNSTGKNRKKARRNSRT